MPTALEFQPGAIADERELRAFDDTFLSPWALLQNGEFSVVPSSGETLWLQVPFPGRRIRSTTIWDFCVMGAPFQVIYVFILICDTA